MFCPRVVLHMYIVVQDTPQELSSYTYLPAYLQKFKIAHGHCSIYSINKKAFVPNTKNDL